MIAARAIFQVLFMWNDLLVAPIHFCARNPDAPLAVVVSSLLVSSHGCGTP